MKTHKKKCYEHVIDTMKDPSGRCIYCGKKPTRKEEGDAEEIIKSI